MRQPLTPRWFSTTHSSQTWMAPTSKCLHLRMTEARGSKNSPWEAEVERSIPLWGRTCTFQKGNGKTQADGLGPCGYVANVVWGLQSVIPLTEEVMFCWHFAFRAATAVTCRLAHTLILAVGWEGRRPWDGGEFRAVMFTRNNGWCQCAERKNRKEGLMTQMWKDTLWLSRSFF